MNIETKTEYRLIQADQRLTLQLQSKQQQLSSVCVEFTRGAVAHRRQFGGGRGQALARAVGLKRGAMPSVLDATAGLGKDSFVLASLGCQVLMLERSPTIAALLRDGMQRAQCDEVVAGIMQRMHLLEVDAVSYMQALAADQYSDVVYLDPMFPLRTKQALVKKEMQALQCVVGQDNDGDILLNTALSRAKQRVVVKRPRLAEPLAGKQPSASIEGKRSRFDLYF